MSGPLVTVIIDTYNNGPFIEQAVDSVLSQDFPLEEVEILVVDDGSTDDTIERMKKYAGRVQYLQKQNGGQASAFNFGLAQAHGKYIALLDGDDYWLPNKLSYVVKQFQANPEAGLVYHPLLQYDVRTGQSQEPEFTAVSGFLPADPRKAVLFDWMFTSSISFRQEVLRKTLPVPEQLRIQADGYLCVLASFLAPIAAIERPLGVYRIHGNNLFFHSSAEPDVARLKRRIESSREISTGLHAWMVSNGYDTTRPEARIACLRYTLMAERDEFLLSPPSRVRFFSHVVNSCRLQEPVMTPRIRAINYFNAVGALFVGYRRFSSLDEFRVRITEFLRRGNLLKRWLPRKSREAQGLNDGARQNSAPREVR